ncbi:MAG: hypothetical protein WBX15_21140 [Thermoanaerobaculia bacterium]
MPDPERRMLHPQLRSLLRIGPAEAIRLSERISGENLQRRDVAALAAGLPEFLEETAGSWNALDTTIVVWNIGESIRSALKANRRLRSGEEFWTAVEAIAGDARYGRGREPFVLLLGQYGGKKRADLLVRLLDDEAVTGQALHALRLLGSKSGIFKARLLADSPVTWIRSEARKYLQHVEGGS